MLSHSESIQVALVNAALILGGVAVLMLINTIAGMA